MFCKNTQPPIWDAFYNAFRAIYSCPCPIEMFVNFSFAWVYPNLIPKFYTYLVGSIPGNNT